MTYNLRLKNDCLRIREFVNPVLEMAEIADRMAKSGNGGKTLLFENTGTAFPVLMNLYGSTPRMLQALGLGAYEEIEQKFNRLFSDVLSPKQSLWDKLKLLPALKQAAQWLPEVRRERGACQDVVMPQPDLSKLPILQCWPHDGGRFITLPMVHTKDPVTGARNVGMYRMQVFSNTTAGMHWHRHKTGARHFAAFAAHPAGDGRFPVAVALGGDPVYAYCAVAPMPENVDEYLLAGFLRNKPVSLVRCLTQPLEVPADADFVIEGYVDVNALLETEGPFGDHTGFYSLEDLYPVMQVTCITHRKDAIYPATVVGIPPQEDAYMSQATERIFLTPVRLAVAPEIIDMHLPVEGVSHNLAIVKIKKDYPGQAIKVAHALWGAGQMMFNKIMIVVDGEVNLTDYPALSRYIAQHYHPATDTCFSSGPLDVLDHAAASPAFGGKICIDATADAAKEATGAGTDDTKWYTFIHKGEKLPASRVVVQFDRQVHLDDPATCVWLLGNNIDAVRDCRVADGQLIIDATTKSEQLFPRRWPNIVCASNETIAAVDARWERLGLGAFIASPSLHYKHLLQKGGAAVALPDEVLLRMPHDTAYYCSPTGWLKIEATDTRLRAVSFCEEAPEPLPAIENSILKKCTGQLDEYFAGTRTTFDLPIELIGSDFQLRVWKELLAIPYGETISYTKLSQRIGDEKAIRAVGTANAKNRLSIIIPCHRVIGADGKLVGYAGGLHRKEWLLRFEIQHSKQGLFRS